MRRAICALLLATAAPAAAELPANAVEAGSCDRSLIGTPLRLPQFSAATQKRLEQDLEGARAMLRIAPDRPESHFWVARRLSYLGRFCESVDVLTAAIAQFPESYELRRYRGRKLARSRQFEAALADYREGLRLMAGKPDHFEPDGIANRVGITLGTYRGNMIYYHAQTSFAVGDYRTMLAGLRTAFDMTWPFAKNDLVPPIAYWTYLAHRKLGEHDAARAAIAQVPAELDLIENAAYHQAVKVMQGRIPLAEAAASKDPNVKFAAAMEHRFAGREAEATRLLREIVVENAQGHWPAEVELVAPDRRAAQAPPLPDVPAER